MAAIKHCKVLISIILVIIFLVPVTLLAAVDEVSASPQAVVTGHWTGSTSQGYPMSLDISSDGIKITLFTISFMGNSQYCGNYFSTQNISTNPPISINNNQFSHYAGAMGLNGQFTSPTNVYGSFYINGYDASCGGFGTNVSWSASRPFPPDPFGKQVPMNGTTNQPTSTPLYWDYNSGASSYQYCIDTSNNNTCDTNWSDAGSSTSIFVSQLNMGTTYYWQVRAVNAYGSSEADGGIWWSYSTQAIPPGPFSKLNPWNGQGNVSTTPTLTWDTSSGAVTYEVCYDTIHNNTCDSSWVTGLPAANTILSGLTYSTTYYWQVRARNSAGTIDGNGEEWWSFSTSAAPAPTITDFSPVVGFAGATITITGTNFSLATDVSFNGIGAAFIVLSDTTITAAVPVDATTGKISITTSGGTTTSELDFTVTAPNLILYAKQYATGSGDCLSWEDACTLQTALSTAVSGDEIWVMQGTHKPSATGERSATFHLKTGVGIYGGFMGTEEMRTQRNTTTSLTILSGDLNGNDNSNVMSTEPTRLENSYHVVTGSGTDSTAVLDGFTVTGGNAETDQGCPGTGCGAGIENTSGSPTLANIIFAINSVYLNGGAMSNMGESNPILINVIFDKNTSKVSAGGAIFNHASNPSFKNVIFSNNWSFDQGGAIYNHDSSSTMTNVAFYNNSTSGIGGAILNYGSSSPILTNVTFRGNTANNGGAIIYIYYYADSHTTIRNSILWGDDPNPFSSGFDKYIISNSVVKNGCHSASTCSNIITADPLMGLPGNYDGKYTVPLLPGSSAIDAGNPAYCPAQDQRGMSRVGACDIGAFESQGFTLTVTGGDNQATKINTSFPAPLQVSVSSNGGSEPVNGGAITFTAPSSGASVIATSQNSTITGGSASVSETANGTLGSYLVSAGASGANFANFNLTNDNKEITSSQLSSTPNPSTFGQTVSFTAAVTAAQGVPTGTVVFLDGAAQIGSAELDGSGHAQLNISSLSVGTHAVITAQYSGNMGFRASASVNYSQAVNQAGTTTVVTSTPNASTFGQTVSFTATVSAGAPGASTPTGTVAFYDNSIYLGSSSVNSSAQAMLSVSALAVGTHSTITAQYDGDTNFNGSTSGSYAQTVNQAGTWVAVVSAPNASTFGQFVTFVAVVSVSSPGAGTPTGMVTFYDNETIIGSSSVHSSGQSALSVSSLAVGTHSSITAQYSGDTNFAGSLSTIYTHTVNKADTTTAVTSTPNPSNFGQMVTFTGTVSVSASGTGTPTGSLSFYDNGVYLGSGPINGSGESTLSLSPLAVGAHSTITAQYAGDTNFNGNTSANYSHAVNQAGTTTALTSTPNASTFGQTVIFTATVTASAPGAGTPTGSVTFYDNSMYLGSALLNGSGKSMFSVSNLAVGSHSTITAQYIGDSNFLGSSSSQYSQTVNPSSTTIALTSTPNASTFGQTVTFTATVTVSEPGTGTPTGTVSFFDNGLFLGSGSVSGSGKSTLHVSTLAVGVHSMITAEYAGDTNFTGSISSNYAQSVSQAGTTTVVTSTPNPSTLGQTVTFTATVSVSAPGAGLPTGTVTFFDGGAVLGSSPVNASGQATLSISTQTVGTHSPITAQYDGNINLTGSTSGSYAHTVNLTWATIDVTSTPNPSIFGQNVTFIATVTVSPPSKNEPTGDIAFYDNGTYLGSAPLNDSGQSSFSVSNLAVGIHSAITAQYSGDTFYNANTSTNYSHSVTKANTSISVTSSGNSSGINQPVTLRAIISALAPGAGMPTGVVTFYAGTFVLGTDLADESGLATLTISTLSVGSNAITAQYDGDDSFYGSTSDICTQSVWRTLYLPMIIR